MKVSLADPGDLLLRTRRGTVLGRGQQEDEQNNLEKRRVLEGNKQETNRKTNRTTREKSVRRKQTRGQETDEQND